MFYILKIMENVKAIGKMMNLDAQITKTITKTVLEIYLEQVVRCQR